MEVHPLLGTHRLLELKVVDVSNVLSGQSACRYISPGIKNDFEL